MNVHLGKSSLVLYASCETCYYRTSISAISAVVGVVCFIELLWSFQWLRCSTAVLNKHCVMHPKLTSLISSWSVRLAQDVEYVVLRKASTIGLNAPVWSVMFT